MGFFLKGTWPYFNWLRIDSEPEPGKESLFSNKMVATGLCSPSLDILCLYRWSNTLIRCPSTLPLETGWSISHCHCQWSRAPDCQSGLAAYYSDYISVASNYWVLKHGLCYSEIISSVLTLDTNDNGGIYVMEASMTSGSQKTTPLSMMPQWRERVLQSFLWT